MIKRLNFREQNHVISLQNDFKGHEMLIVKAENKELRRQFAELQNPH